MKSFKKLFVLGLILSALSVNGHIIPVNLKCEYLKNPEGIDMPDPRFFWQLNSREQGQLQSAYRIIVSSSKENIEKNVGDMSDSKKKKSSLNTQVVYQGKSLQPATDYYWKVIVWDKNKKPSNWSETAHFTTGLFADKDWKNAQWIAWKPQSDWETAWWERKILNCNAPNLRCRLTSAHE